MLREHQRNDFWSPPWTRTFELGTLLRSIRAKHRTSTLTRYWELTCICYTSEYVGQDSRSTSPAFFTNSRGRELAPRLPDFLNVTSTLRLLSRSLLRGLHQHATAAPSSSAYGVDAKRHHSPATASSAGRTPSVAAACPAPGCSSPGVSWRGMCISMAALAAPSQLLASPACSPRSGASQGLHSEGPNSRARSWLRMLLYARGRACATPTTQ